MMERTPSERSENGGRKNGAAMKKLDFRAIEATRADFPAWQCRRGGRNQPHNSHPEPPTRSESSRERCQRIFQRGSALFRLSFSSSLTPSLRISRVAA